MFENLCLPVGDALLHLACKHSIVVDRRPALGRVTVTADDHDIPVAAVGLESDAASHAIRKPRLSKCTNDDVVELNEVRLNAVYHGPSDDVRLQA
jgi:hypothetical protein